MTSLFARNGVHTIVDGQFGSTGKGVLAAWLAAKSIEAGTPFAWTISNAGPNSGHTFYHGDEKHVLKQLPTFAVARSLLTNNVEYVHLSAGAVIDFDILIAEARRYPKVQICVSPNAAVITPRDKDAESEGTIAAVAGTRSGTGAVLARKIMRDPNAVFSAWYNEFGRLLPDNIHMDHPVFMHRDHRIFMEVSQGFSLGINSEFYPKVTSRECTVMQGIADARLPPQSVTRTFLSMRTFPIRVGNVDGYSSGDCYPDQKETTWQDLGQTPELTTVTQRVRRVFTWSQQQAVEATRANQPTHLFLNFLNYLRDEDERDKFANNIVELKSLTGVPFDVIGCDGPRSENVLW